MTHESVAINIGGDETAGIAARFFARGKVAHRLERTRAERATATLARRASAGNWSAAAQDDDKLDIPGYRSQPLGLASGTGVAPDIHRQPTTITEGRTYERQPDHRGAVHRRAGRAAPARVHPRRRQACRPRRPAGRRPGPHL